MISSKVKVTIALFIPFIVLLGWCVSLSAKRASGNIVRVEVEGYDPRDLLSGHYLEFRFALGQMNPCTGAPGNTQQCVCYGPIPSSPLHQPITSGNCDELLRSCPAVLRGTCEGSRFITGIERYYIAESLAPALAQTPANSSVELALDSMGRPALRQMYVEDQTIEQFAQDALSRKAASTK